MEKLEKGAVQRVEVNWRCLFELNLDVIHVRITFKDVTIELGM
jgi:hypothetical protein